MPSITITLPVYNGMPHLPSAVESVLRQSYSDFEFLIIDDGSTDASIEYLRSLRDPRVRLVVRENRGLGATLNELFHTAGTQYVARMDADDRCEPQRLQKQVAFLQEHPEVVMLGTSFAFLIGDRVTNAATRATRHQEIRQQLLEKRSGVCHPTIVVARKAWEAVGGYRIAGCGEDLDFCLRLCDYGRVANIPEVLYQYRLGETSLSSTRRNELQLGYAYGVACARAREACRPEPPLAKFRATWERRPVWLKAVQLIDDIGQRFYRRSLMRRAQGRAAVSWLCLAIGALCKPHTALCRILAPRVRHV